MISSIRTEVPSTTVKTNAVVSRLSLWDWKANLGAGGYRFASVEISTDDGGTQIRITGDRKALRLIKIVKEVRKVT